MQVSIVIPSHNYAAYLPEAIESALAQTHRELDITVVDDGSTDDSVAIARRYGDRIRLVTQERAGIVKTCNRGVAEARGELITILSADDTIAPEFVERLAGALERHPEASFAFCDFRVTGTDKAVAQSGIPTRDGVFRCGPFSLFWMLVNGNYIHPTSVIRRSAYLEAGGYSDELEEFGYEDWDFWLALAERGHRGTYVPEPLLSWRRHEAASRNPLSARRWQQAYDLMARRHAALRNRRYRLADRRPLRTPARLLHRAGSERGLSALDRALFGRLGA
jgi:glycosyltransferase involved in cell wall biosynthesis